MEVSGLSLPFSVWGGTPAKFAWILVIDNLANWWFARRNPPQPVGSIALLVLDRHRNESLRTQGAGASIRTGDPLR
jgi:hypothetical protein